MAKFQLKCLVVSGRYAADVINLIFEKSGLNLVNELFCYVYMQFVNSDLFYRQFLKYRDEMISRWLYCYDLFQLRTIKDYPKVYW